VFAVNILSAEQGALSQYFASKDRPRDAAAFGEVAHRTGGSGAPLLDGALAYLDCRLATSHDAGDHTIFIGEVLGLGKLAEEVPLLFYQGKYRELKR
jgi:flavin reductase (DIM6/NTAB) family NADH-FMN oxidoreductase RutF